MRGRSFAGDDRALASFGRLLLIYFAIGGGIVFSLQSYCDYQVQQNVTQDNSACRLSISGSGNRNLSVESVRAVGLNTTSASLPRNATADTGILANIAGAIAGGLAAAWNGLVLVSSVAGWPAMALTIVDGVPPIAVELVGFSLTILIVVAGLMWFRGVQ